MYYSKQWLYPVVCSDVVGTLCYTGIQYTGVWFYASVVKNINSTYISGCL